MPLQGYFQPKFLLSHLGAKAVNLSTDTFKVGLIASGTLAARGTTEGYEFVSDLLSNGGSALTEVSTSGTGYTRQNLASITWSASGLVVTFSSANPTWISPNFTTVYGWLHDETASSGTDATRPLVYIWDWGAPQAALTGTPSFTLDIATDLSTWTATA